MGLGRQEGSLRRVLDGRKEGLNEGLEDLGGTSKAGRKATWEELSCLARESLAMPKPSIHPAPNHPSS